MQAVAKKAGRKKEAISCTAYLTLSIGDDVPKAQAKADDFMSAYYGLRPDVLKKCRLVSRERLNRLVEYLQSYLDAGASQLVLRFAGDHDRHLKIMSKVRDHLELS